MLRKLLLVLLVLCGLGMSFVSSGCVHEQRRDSAPDTTPCP